MTVEERSEALKNAGNKKLNLGHFNEVIHFRIASLGAVCVGLILLPFFFLLDFFKAIALYTEAISLHETTVLYSNRSMAHSKLEAYGAAVTDAELAIELDPSYVKAYYRRAAGNFALQKYKLSVKDFKHVCKLVPKDKVARVRLAEADKAAKAKAFADAIESEQTAPFGENCGQVDT